MSSRGVGLALGKSSGWAREKIKSYVVVLEK